MSQNQDYINSDTANATAVQKAGSTPLQRPEPYCRVDALAYVLFERQDLDAQRGFLQDFGMQLAAEDNDTLYFRGHGTSAWFYRVSKGKRSRYLGAGFCVNSAQELTAIADRHEQDIEALDGPGGGQRVRLLDPDGFIVDFVFGRSDVPRTATRETAFIPNTPTSKTRVNATVRTATEPCALEKLGHMVMAVTDFTRSAQWYMEHLGLIPTDVQCVSDGTPVLSFFRCDRGAEPADHHTVVLLQNIAPGLMHTAYETLDVDSIGQGAQHLRLKGWQHHWGIGRHILGSQIFDYWLDPAGVEMEHYADGDVFTADHPTGYHPLDPGSLWSWGDDVPPPATPGLWKMLKFVLSGKAAKMPPVLGKMRSAMAKPPRPWLGK